MRVKPQNMQDGGRVLPLSERIQEVWNEPTPGSIFDIAKSAYKGLRGAGRAASGAYTVQPEVPGQWSEGDEFRAQHARQAMREDAASLGGTLMTSALPLPLRPAGTLGTMAGVRGAGGIPAGIPGGRQAIARAQSMFDRGASKGDIWHETGVAPGIDKQMRLEIPDRESRFTNYAVDRLMDPHRLLPVRGKVEQLFSHDPVLNAYPGWGKFDAELSINPSVPGGASGYISRDKNFIKMEGADLENLKSGLLHEGQHYIQRTEGFPRGASPEHFAPDNNKYKFFLKSRDEIMKSVLGMVLKDRKDEIKNMGAKDFKRFFSEFTANLPDSTLKKFDDLARDQAYVVSAGEVEARNVQKRMNFLADELRKKPPWLTEDISRARQHVFYSCGGRVQNMQNGGRVLPSSELIDEATATIAMEARESAASRLRSHGGRAVRMATRLARKKR